MNEYEKELTELEQKLQRLQQEKIDLNNKKTGDDKRKQRQRETYKIGGTFMKFFDIDNVEDAEKIAIYFAKAVKAREETWKKINPQKRMEDAEKLQEFFKQERSINDAEKDSRTD